MWDALNDLLSNPWWTGVAGMFQIIAGALALFTVVQGRRVVEQGDCVLHRAAQETADARAQVAQAVAPLWGRSVLQYGDPNTGTFWATLRCDVAGEIPLPRAGRGPPLPRFLRTMSDLFLDEEPVG